MVRAAQTTYDPRDHREMFDSYDIGEPIIRLFGMSGEADMHNPELIPLYEDASPINHLTAEDPPILFFYPQANEELGHNPSHGRYIHHPKFGALLKAKADPLGVPCTVLHTEDFPNEGKAGPVERCVEFFLKYL